MIRLVIMLVALFVLTGMFFVLYTYRPVRKDEKPAQEEPFDYTSDIQEKLDLEVLSRLTDAEREEVKRYAAHVHYDTFHGPNAKGIYSCCIWPSDPRKVRSQDG